jgi:hypothetical protein
LLDDTNVKCGAGEDGGRCEREESDDHALNPPLKGRLKSLRRLAR